MKGLLYKNLIITIRQFKSLLFIFAVFFIMGVIPNGSYWAVYAAVMLSMFTGSMLRVDEAAKWNQYCSILPLSEKTVVTSYYAGSYALLTLAALLYLIVSTIVRLIWGGENVILPTASMMIIIPFLMTALNIPVTLKFGSQKAPIVQMITVASFAGIGMIVIGKGRDAVSFFSRISSSLLIYGAMFFTLIAAAVSWFISVKIYENKEIS